MLLCAKGTIFLLGSFAPSMHAFSLLLGGQPLSFPSSYPTSHRWSWHGKWEKEAKPYLCVCLGEETRSFLIPSFRVESVNDYGGADLVLTPCQTPPTGWHKTCPSPPPSSPPGLVSGWAYLFLSSVSEGFLNFRCLLFICNVKVKCIPFMPF